MMDQTVNVDTTKVGFNVKSLVAFIGGIITIVIVVIGSVNSLRGEIREIKGQIQGDAKYNDLRMRTLEISVAAQEIRLTELTKQVNANTVSLTLKR